jgi:hypothetical protein
VHILISLAVLAIATFAAIGWGRGNLFVSVFLSLPVGLATLLFAFQADHSGGGGAVVCLLILAVIWAPRVIRRLVPKEQPLPATHHLDSWRGTRWSSRP